MSLNHTAYLSSPLLRFALVAAMTMVSSHAQESVPTASSAASEATSIDTEPRIADGRNTRAWLATQGAKTQASSTRQTLSGPVMSKVHERYVKSFSTAIPEKIRDNTSTSSK